MTPLNLMAMGFASQTIRFGRIDDPYFILVE
jgi:hypothetical protein